jgi:uncharacterized protein (TIGR02246 family)
MTVSIHSLSLAAAAALMAACTQGPAGRTNTLQADEAALRSVVDRYLVSWNAGDSAALGSFFTEDAIEMQPDGPAHEGRQAILDGEIAFFAQFTATQAATVTEVAVDGDLALIRGSWSVKSAPKAGGSDTTRTGKWLVLSKRQADGSWRIWRWIWNEQPTASGGTAARR